MTGLSTFLLDFLAQFAGGRGGAENELARFGLAAGFWAVLLILTLGRLREEERPHERWLAYGFTFGLIRETFMFSIASLDILGVIEEELLHPFFPPIEHALAMAAVIVVAGAFIRFLLEDTDLAGRYIRVGLAVTIFDYLATFWWWYLFHTSHPESTFGQTWADWLFRITASIIFAYPILLFYKRKIPGWIRDTVIVALSFFFLGEFLMLFNLATGEVYKDIFSPVRHSLHILAIPLLGHVYYLEAREKGRKAEERLQQLAEFNLEIVSSAPVGIVTVSRDGQVTSANNAFLEMMGSPSLEETLKLGMNISSVKRSGITGSFNKAITDRESFEMKGIPYMSHWGKKLIVDVKGVPQRDKNGDIIGVILIIDDITARAQAEEELQAAREKLEKAYIELFGVDRLKTDIIANVTHELRTPITIFLASLELARDEDVKEKRNEILYKTEASVRRLNEIVENLVIAADIQKGKFQLNLTELDLEKVISDSIVDMGEYASKRGVTIDVLLPKDLPKVEGDHIALKRVFENIIHNAIKFRNDEGGWVKVRAETGHHSVQISISDNGIGFSKDKLDMIFLPLYQIDPTSTRGFEGTGMGLAVAKRIVTAHYGRIWAESDLGKGTTIYFNLPVKQSNP